MAGEMILVIDTSTTAGSIALCCGERLLAEIVVDSLSNHSDRLLLHVDQVLREIGCELSDIDAFAVIDGPGAFTGLRVGVTVAKGLARATRRPLYGISSLHMLAGGVPCASLPVCALLDARKHEVYTATFTTTTRGVCQLDEPRAVSPQTLLEEISVPTLFVGSGALLYRDLIKERLGPLAEFAPWSCHTPRASSVASIALDRLLSGVKGDPELLVPRYLRLSEAEIARQKA